MNSFNHNVKGWDIQKVGDVLTFEYGKGLRKDKRNESGNIPVYGSNGIVGYHSEALVNKPCLVIGRKGAAGVVHISQTPCWPIDTTYYVLEPNRFKLEFLYYFLSHINLGDLDKSTAIPGLNRNDVYALEIPIPPLQEQERIVAKIEELFTQLDAGVAELHAAQRKLKRYRQSVLKAAVTGELTREWRAAHQGELEPASQLLERILAERKQKWEQAELDKMRAKGKVPLDDGWRKKYKAPQPPQTEGLPELPQGWEWVTLPQIGELNRGKSKHRPRNEPFLYDGPYPFIQTGDIKQANGFIREYSQTYSEKGLQQSRLWPKGTLCITIAANIADTAILSFDSCFPDSVVGFLHQDNKCNVQFVEYFFRTAKSNIERYAPATAQKNINLRILSEIALPFPPIREQNKIVDELDKRLSVAYEIEKEINNSITKLSILRQSILKHAFEGRLVSITPLFRHNGLE